MMPEYSDTVRPGVVHLSPLGHPDVRLHLPKHHAIASWSTPEGRQAPFIAQTIPLCVDPERIALHAARQRERGGRALTELLQPHWLRAHATLSQGTAETPTPVGIGPAQSPPQLPPALAESYRELAELDRAHSVRWARPVGTPMALAPDRLDIQVLALIASLGHVLTTQLHRHFNSARSPTTTQRRLKRLSDAGLLARFQFYRRDGGGVPMCYVITEAGLQVLLAHGFLGPTTGAETAMRPSRTSSQRDQQLRQARHEVRVAGWVLALARLTGGSRCTLRGPEEAVLSPPTRPAGGGRVALGPGDLRLPGGRAPHDFLCADAGGERVEIERFHTLRPDAVVQISGAAAGSGSDAARRPPPVVRPDEAPATPRAGAAVGDDAALDVMVELDDRHGSDRWIAKLERYDHFLAGWSAHTARYGRRPQAVPIVAFVCRDRSRARECAQRADLTLRACRAYAGEYPFDWQYPGRERALFFAERDVHEGALWAQGVPRLPPDVRVSAARGDPRTGEATAEPRSLRVAPAPTRA